MEEERRREQPTNRKENLGGERASTPASKISNLEHQAPLLYKSLMNLKKHGITGVVRGVQLRGKTDVCSDKTEDLQEVRRMQGGKDRD